MAADKIKMNDEELDQITGGSKLSYVTVAGDTLGALAKRFNVPVEKLMEWNNIKNPDLITIGQTLVIKF